MTLFDAVSAVIEVTEDEHAAVAVVVHMLESGRVRLHDSDGARSAAESDRSESLRRTG